ncbi:hypothetical protein HN958_03440 [Candidatus Falkowbacteria bacterium]|mgnify:FL=1|jgi:hypothetical protein|nr:hypothetical protein [Candidatus Falkowbacteria bacterium]MBT7007531.1 hypothetical protein [Candidatus Falkowbacteria bacterium]
MSMINWNNRTEEQKDLFIHGIEGLILFFAFCISLLFWPESKRTNQYPNDWTSMFGAVVMIYLMLSVLDKIMHLFFLSFERLHAWLKWLPLLVILYGAAISINNAVNIDSVTMEQMVQGWFSVQGLTVILFAFIGFCDIELLASDNGKALTRFLRKHQ